MLVKSLDSASEMGCELMWCINTKVDGSPMLGLSHMTNVLSRTVFECTPMWFRAIVERARAVYS